MTDENADGTVETPTVEELQARLDKAEAKIVDMKKSTKEVEPKVESEDTPKADVDINAILDERDYFNANPEMLWYKEQIKAYTSKWLSYAESEQLVKSNDETFKNREKTKAMNITWGSEWGTKSSYTMEELASIWKQNPSAYADIMAKFKTWSVTVAE